MNEKRHRFAYTIKSDYTKDKNFILIVAVWHCFSDLWIYSVLFVVNKRQSLPTHKSSANQHQKYPPTTPHTHILQQPSPLTIRNDHHSQLTKVSIVLMTSSQQFHPHLIKNSLKECSQYQRSALLHSQNQANQKSSTLTPCSRD